MGAGISSPTAKCQRVMNFKKYKGSAWVSAYAGTRASGRAGQHFELFDSTLDRVKQVTTHTIVVYAYSM